MWKPCGSQSIRLDRSSAHFLPRRVRPQRLEWGGQGSRACLIRILSLAGAGAARSSRAGREDHLDNLLGGWERCVAVDEGGVWRFSAEAGNARTETVAAGRICPASAASPTTRAMRRSVSSSSSSSAASPRLSALEMRDGEADSCHISKIGRSVSRIELR